METKKTYFAYSLKDWEGAFAENPRDRIDFIFTEKVFKNYADARNEAETRLKERVATLDKDSDWEIQDFADTKPKYIDNVGVNEECYLKKLFDENNEELCTLQIMKYEYER